MIAPDVFRDQAGLTGPGVVLEPLSEVWLADYLPMLREPENLRLTGSQVSETFDHELFVERAEHWLRTRREQHDRADWAILRAPDRAFLGEVVLNEFDPDNAAANLRILLAGPAVYGKGHGTEAIRLVLDHAFGRLGLHRIGLEVFEFNPRARRVYEKCGFRVEGVRREALRWDGAWHDAVTMAVLSTDQR